MAGRGPAHRHILVAITLAWAAIASGTSACEARFPPGGFPGRTAEDEFYNPRSDGPHENWAPEKTRLEFHAGFAQESVEYDHHILGSLGDMKLLTIHVRLPDSNRITCPAEALLGPGEVFEDIAPRIVDIDNDGMPEVIVVQTDIRRGARLAIYDRRAHLVAATPYIGQTHRWLAPLGADDLDGDGNVEIAYVDRPHLARILRVWRFRNGTLTEVAQAPGHTNHAIGDETISGGLRFCDLRNEIVTLSPDRRRILVTTLAEDRLTTRDHAAFTGPGSLTSALLCR